jgi:Tfp pilus assembly protein PilO
MSRLSKQKRNQLVLTTLLVVAAVIGLWFTLIRYQQKGLQELNRKKKMVESDLAQVVETKKNSAQIEAELLIVSNRLVLLEENMASGDLYSSMYSSIRKFKQPYKVEIPQYTPPGSSAVEMNMLPKFPYKQFTVAISGTAYFYDLGKFIADFENEFPTSRILNLEITPASAQNAEEKEKLAFKMDIVSLVSGTAITSGKP